MTSPILELYAQHVQGLRPGSGDNYTGYCPLHGERPGASKPSLSVNASSGLWHCFAGCGGGSVASFLTAVGLSRLEVDKAASQVKPYTKKAARRSPVLTGSAEEYVLPEKVLGLFDSCPIDLVESGFDEKTLWMHDIGYDVERSRITFPLRNLQGDLVGIIGRRKTTDFGKYKVYVREIQELGFPRYHIRKGEYLWRGEKVYARCRAGIREPVYVVEGFKAALWMVQAGLHSTVALMGTSMSEAQRLGLERITDTVIFCLDNDEAGRKSSLKNAKRITGARSLVVSFPSDVRQPDDIPVEILQEVIHASALRLGEVKRKWEQK